MTEQRGLSKRKLPMLEMVFIMLISAYYLLPSLSNGVIHFTIPLVLGLLYIVYVVFKDKKDGMKFLLFVGIICVFSLNYLNLEDLLSFSVERIIETIVSKFYQYFCMYLPLLFFSRVVANTHRNQKKYLLIFFAILFVYVIVQTLQILAVNPNAIRQWEMFDELAEDNIGNYYFVYAIPIVIVTLAICLSKLKTIYKVIDIVIIIFLLYFVVKSQYTLALLISIIGILFRLFLSIKQTFFKMLFFFAVFFTMFFVPDMLLFAATHIESTQMATRLAELYDFFTSGNLSGYNINGRLSLYGKSILAFLKSPILGNSKLDFDGHATCLTVLADTGIIGGIPFYYLLISANKKIKKHLGDNSKEYFTIFFCLMMMGFTNPIHSSLPLSLTTWFIAPLIIDFVYKKDKK